MYLRLLYKISLIIASMERGTLGSMVRIFTFAILACAFGALGADSPKEESKSMKVLIIGNSYSYPLNRHFPAVAKSAGLNLDLAVLYIGGCSLEKHWNNLSSTNAAYKPYRYDRYTNGVHIVNGGRINSPEALGLEKWDVIVTHNNSHALDMKLFEPWTENLVKGFREKCPGAKIFLHQTWSYSVHDKRLKTWNLTQETMAEKVRKNYDSLAKKYGLYIIPSGSAIQEWRRQLPIAPTENSFGGDLVGGATGDVIKGHDLPNEKQFEKQPDGSYKVKCDCYHLNDSGDYFVALVWAARLFDSDLAELKYKPDYVTVKNAELMRKIAASFRPSGN